MLNGLPPPTLVQDSRAFARLMEDLAAQREIAVDTEADSFYSHREKVCLVRSPSRTATTSSIRSRASTSRRWATCSRIPRG
jgi:ribonuclease D